MRLQALLRLVSALACARCLEITPGLREGFNQFGRVQSRGPPDLIYRIRLTITAVKQAMDVEFEGVRLVDFYDVRVRWSEPSEWHDGQESGRMYQYACWITLDQEVRVVVNMTVGWYFQGYHENYRFPPNFAGTIQCNVRAINSDGVPGVWSFTEAQKVTDIPIYFPGLPGLDLRRFSNAEILTVLQNLAARQASTGQLPQQNQTVPASITK